MRFKRSATIVFALVASLSLSATALAAPAVDTVVTQGYDSDQMALIFSVSPLLEPGDSPTPTLDCGLNSTEEDDFDYEVGETQDGSTYTPVTSLQKDGEDVTFQWEDNYFNDATNDEEYTYGDPVAEECTLYSLDVTGPNGQVNHGTVVSSVVHALKDLGYRGAGCLVKVFAQTEWGKGDTQLTVEEAAALAELGDGEETTPLTVTLDTIDTACNHGKSDVEHGRSADAKSGDHPGKGPKTDNPGKAKGHDK